MFLRHNKCIFVTCDRKEYDDFPYKNLVPLDEHNTLQSMTKAIFSCKCFVGNQSSPLALAVAMGKPCLAELFTADAPSYMQMDYCNERCWWYLDRNKHFLHNIDSYMVFDPHWNLHNL
jgi:ADP-heptose:LPS heptosyltransferase